MVCLLYFRVQIQCVSVTLPFWRFDTFDSRIMDDSHTFRVHSHRNFCYSLFLSLLLLVVVYFSCSFRFHSRISFGSTVVISQSLQMCFYINSLYSFAFALQRAWLFHRNRNSSESLDRTKSTREETSDIKKKAKTNNKNDQRVEIR